MNITFDDIIMHQAVNNVMRLMFGGTNDQRMIEKISHIDESVGTDPFVRPKVFERITGMERILGYLERKGLNL